MSLSKKCKKISFGNTKTPVTQLQHPGEAENTIIKNFSWVRALSSRYLQNISNPLLEISKRPGKRFLLTNWFEFHLKTLTQKLHRWSFKCHLILLTSREEPTKRKVQSLTRRSPNPWQVEEELGLRSRPQRMTTLPQERVKAHLIDLELRIK